MVVETINKSQMVINKVTTIKDQEQINKETIKDLINKETINLETITKDLGKMVIILITMDSTDLIILDNIIMSLVQMGQEVFLTNQIKVLQVVKEDMEEMVVKVIF